MNQSVFMISGSFTLHGDTSSEEWCRRSQERSCHDFARRARGNKTVRQGGPQAP